VPTTVHSPSQPQSAICSAGPLAGQWTIRTRNRAEIRTFVSAPRRLGPLSDEDMTPEQRSVRDTIFSERGQTPLPQLPARPLGPFEALLNKPRLADAVSRLSLQLRFDSSLPARLNEIAILLTTRRWSAQFAFYAHRHISFREGLDPTVVEAIANNERPLDLDEEGSAVYQFTSELLEYGSVGDKAFEAVATRFGKQGVIDLIGVVGLYCLNSFILNVDRYPLPGGETPLEAS
jgi:4-carboxymuconolactone decarboxylase